MELVQQWNTHDYLTNLRDPERQTARYLIRKITGIAINTFDTNIEQLPNANIEYFLWHYGMCAIWDHPLMGLVCTPVSILGYDINGIPNKWKPVIKNNMIPATIPELTEENAVVFYDTLDYNVFRKQCLLWIKDYADVTETIRQQVFNQKTPLLAMAGTKGVVEKIKKGLIDIKNNFKILFVDSDFKDKVQALDFNAPYNVESLVGYRKSIENEMLAFCGIDSSEGFQKKERLIVDEQESNDEQLNYVLAGCLKARQNAIDKLGLFGLTGSTEINGMVRPIEQIEENVSEDDQDD